MSDALFNGQANHYPPISTPISTPIPIPPYPQMGPMTTEKGLKNNPQPIRNQPKRKSE